MSQDVRRHLLRSEGAIIYLQGLIRSDRTLGKHYRAMPIFGLLLCLSSNHDVVGVVRVYPKDGRESAIAIRCWNDCSVALRQVVGRGVAVPKIDLPFDRYYAERGSQIDSDVHTSSLPDRSRVKNNVQIQIRLVIRSCEAKILPLWQRRAFTPRKGREPKDCCLMQEH